MYQQFQKHISNHFPFLKEHKLIVACSGGLDSIVLTHLMYKAGFDLAIAHCNFKLRDAESDADEQFVESIAKKLDIPFFSQSFDTLKYAKNQRLSTQMAARSLRYEWFHELCNTQPYHFVLTAHHADDSLETFFINLSRGSGIKGLKGIPAQNDFVVRPLLPFSRDEILTYAKEEQLFWREDSSNASSKYLRNKIRHELIPAFKGISDKMLQNFQKSQAHLNDSQLLINDYMALIYNLIISEGSEGYEINIEKLKELPNTNALLFEILQPFGFTDFDAATNLLDAQSGKQIFSETHRLLKDRASLILTEIPVAHMSNAPEETVQLENKPILITKNTKRLAEPIELKLEITTSIGKIDYKTIYVDNEKLNYPLELRKWREGDVFQPFGMKGKKKLSKFFKDEKLSLAAKENVWLLCSSEEIVWVIGYRADGRFQVTADTEQILKITTL